jgi:prolyl 4-hydroxylase
MIQEYPNFLTEDQCNLLIGLGESGALQFGQISNDKLGYRKAKVRWFNDSDLIDRIRDQVEVITGISKEKHETFHFVKYSLSGEYKPHYDGKNRIKTALIYLNDGFKGGETYFPKIDKRIIPETGKLIIWDNLTEDGGNDPDSYHAGLPVEFGTKYIAVIWIKK